MANHIHDLRIHAMSAALPLSSESPPDSKCDWRLSRAARDIIAQSLRPALGFTSDDKQSVWQLFEEAIISSASPLTLQKSCSLLPTRDLQRVQQESVRLVPAMRQPPKPYRRTPLPTNWYQCGLCNKTFVSLYYMDKHFDRHHMIEKSTDMICPANDYCSFLSPTACHDRADELEPDYYESERRRKQKQAKYAKFYQESPNATMKRQQSMPCRPLDMQQANQECHQVVESCFAHNRTLQYLLKASWCSRSCEDRWMRLLQRGISGSAGKKTHRNLEWQVHPLGYDWWSEQEWIKHSNYSLFGNGRLHWNILLVLLIGTAAMVAVLNVLWRHRKRRTQPMSRLLQRNKGASAVTSLLRGRPPGTSYKGKRIDKRKIH